MRRRRAGGGEVPARNRPQRADTRAASRHSSPRAGFLFAPLGRFLRGDVFQLDLTGAAMRGGALGGILGAFDALSKRQRRVDGREVIRMTGVSVFLCLRR